MICDEFNYISELISVDHMQWKEGGVSMEPRTYASLTFRIRGNAQITAENHSCSVHVNEVLYMPQNLAYTAQYTDTELLAVHFKTTQSAPQPEVYALKNSEQMVRLFWKMKIVWENREPGYIMEVLSVLYRILSELCREQATERLCPEFLRGVSFMNAHFRSNTLSVRQICHDAGINENKFRKLMQLHYRKTPVEYWTELRLDYARNLISCGMSVEQAAWESGFNDSKYFARVVKKHWNCTPKDFKTFGK